MSHFDAIRRALTTHFLAEWGQTTPVALPNAAFTPPSAAPWVRLTILFANSERTLLTGDPATGTTTSGLLVLQVFVPEGTGDGGAMRLADTASGILHERTLTIPLAVQSLRLYTPRVNTIGPSGGWHQINVACPFEFTP